MRLQKNGVQQWKKAMKYLQSTVLFTRKLKLWQNKLQCSEKIYVRNGDNIFKKLNIFCRYVSKDLANELDEWLVVLALNITPAMI